MKFALTVMVTYRLQLAWLPTSVARMWWRPSSSVLSVLFSATSGRSPTSGKSPS